MGERIMTGSEKERTADSREEASKSENDLQKHTDAEREQSN